MKTFEYIVFETPRGWLNTTTGICHKSPVHAVRSILQRSRKLAKDVASHAVTISWEPKSEAGRALVKAMTSPPK